MKDYNSLSNLEILTEIEKETIMLCGNQYEKEEDQEFEEPASIIEKCTSILRKRLAN